MSASRNSEGRVSEPLTVVADESVERPRAGCCWGADEGVRVAVFSGSEV